jgi:Kef-type K+ transport system membrane component KefB
LRERLSSILWITGVQVVVTALGIMGIVFLFRDLFPSLQGQGPRTALAVAMIFALVAVAKSPATTIAVITELRARGPLTDTVLGISVLKDIIILLLIAAVIPAALVLSDPARGFDYTQLAEISQAILISLALGAIVGWLVALYLTKLSRRPVLFVLATAFCIVELAHALHLESESFILMGMAGGFVVQNLSSQGPTLVGALEANSLPLYALFFAVAGADLDLSLITSVWKAGALIIVARLVLIFLSTFIGAVAAGDPPVIRYYGWMGFIAKAGVTLGLANIVRERFAPWGAMVAAIIIAMIAVNQLIGPPLFRLSLVRAGEAR